MNTMKWLLRREFWENRGGFFWAPVIAGSVFVVVNIMAMMAVSAAAGRSHIKIGMVKLDQLLQHIDAGAMQAAGAGIDLTLISIAALVGNVSGIVVFFYSIGALYDERRDRSILFWKSLPLSDRDTVISKALSAGLVAPAIGIVAGIATGVLTLFVIGLFAAFHGQNVFGLMFVAAHPLRVIALTISTLPITALWALPAIGWLMLVSVWARNKPLLWAVGLPVGAGLLSNWFDIMQTIGVPDTWFWTTIVSRLLLSVLPGSWMDFDALEQIEGGPEVVWEILSFSSFYATLGRLDMWVGVVAGIAMLALAIRMRRWRDEA